jgi:hypothetical protein
VAAPLIRFLEKRRFHASKNEFVCDLSKRYLLPTYLSSIYNPRYEAVRRSGSLTTCLPQEHPNVS